MECNCLSGKTSEFSDFRQVITCPFAALIAHIAYCVARKLWPSCNACVCVTICVSCVNVCAKGKLKHFYRSQTKFAKVMFLHVSVILSTEGGRVVVSKHALQVSRSTPSRKVEGFGGGSPDPHPGGN